MAEVRFWRNGLGEEKWDTTQLNTVAGSQLYDRVIAIQPVIRLTILLLYLTLSLILPVFLSISSIPLLVINHSPIIFYFYQSPWFAAGCWRNSDTLLRAQGKVNHRVSTVRCVVLCCVVLCCVVLCCVVLCCVVLCCIVLCCDVLFISTARSRLYFFILASYW